MSLIDVGDYASKPLARAIEKAHAAQGIAWNLPLDHWSPSSLAMLQRCPHQFQQRYIKKRKARPAEAPVTGSAVHDAIERNYRQKIESHEDLPIVDLLDYYAEEGFPKTALAEQEQAGESILWDTSPDAARARGRVMLSEYHGTVAPRIQPIEVELKVSADFGLAVPIEGRFDVDRTNSVIDVKTGKQAVKKPKEDWRIQGAVYAKARNKPVEFHSIGASPKTHNVTIVTPLESENLLVHPTVQQREELARSLRSLSNWACLLMAMYGPDEDWPTLGTFHQWSCSYCGFRNNCPAWKE